MYIYVYIYVYIYIHIDHHQPTGVLNAVHVRCHSATEPHGLQASLSRPLSAPHTQCEPFRTAMQNLIGDIIEFPAIAINMFIQIMRVHVCVNIYIYMIYIYI